MRLVMKFQVKRDIASYLLHVYWPTVLTTVLSWISFWMNHESSAARVTIGRSRLHPREEPGSLCSGESSKREKLKQYVITQARKQDLSNTHCTGVWPVLPNGETPNGDGVKQQQGGILAC